MSMAETVPNREPTPHSGRVWRYLPLLFWMALIFLASTSELSASNTNLVLQPLLRWFFPHISDERISLVHVIVRKSGHFAEYAILGFLAGRAFISSGHRRLRQSWFLAALVLVCVYALSDEYHQSFVPSRTASIYDSLIDTVGGLAALVLRGWRIKRRKQQTLH